MPSLGKNNGMADGWFKTDKTLYDQVDGSTPEVSPVHERSAIPLSNLLSHMSLAYSPITKGLHVASPSAQRRLDSDDCAAAGDLPGIQIGAEAGGHDMIVQSCLRDDVQKEEKDAWTSKIGYEDASEQCDEDSGKRSDENALTRTGASSFSSIVSSLSSDVSRLQPEGEDDEVASHGDDRSQISFDCGEQSKFFIGDSPDSPKLAKRKGISGFFSKSLFNWKGSGNSSPSSWKSLGKSILPTPSEFSKSPNLSLRGSSQSINDSGGGQKYGDVVASSTALILHDRPANLPAKSQDEVAKHHQLYQDIVNAAKLKEEHFSKLRKKTLQKKLKQEDQLAKIVAMWNDDIIPNWTERRKHRRTRELWWEGLPPCVRGRVWRLAVDNDLNVTPQLYEICAARALERLRSGTTENADCVDGCDNESSMQLIQLDIERTFPQLCIFQKGGPYYSMLESVLGAYVCYRPDVGYVQGMSFLAAILILNMDPPHAFICFANLLNRPCLHAFFTLSQSEIENYYSTYNDLLKENFPRLWAHMIQSGLTPDLYLLDWVYSVFGKAVSLDVACRIWDVFLRDGEEFIFATTLGILHLYEKELLELDFVRSAQLLTRLPDTLSVSDLFKSISSVKMTVGKLTFTQILQTYALR